MIKNFKMFENKNKERIDTNILINDLKKNNNFKKYCDSERVELAIYACLSDFIGLNFDFPKSEDFELVDAWRENGEYYHEKTCYGIFQRKEDGKFFKFVINYNEDNIFMYPYLEEVSKKKPKREFDWD